MHWSITPFLLAAALGVTVAKVGGTQPSAPRKDEPKKNKTPLVCELSDLPEKARAGQEVKVVVRLSNSGDKPFPLLGHHVEYMTSVGTGVGVATRKVSERPTEKVPAEQPALKLPAAFARQEILGGAFPEKPADIAAILTEKELAGGKGFPTSVTITLPKEPGKYEVSAYVRSWTYFGVRNGIPMLDPKEVDRLYVERVSSEWRTILITDR